MKITFKKVALLAVLSLAAVSCQKETLIDPVSIACEEAAVKTVVYTVDGESYQMTISDEASWNAFLDWLFALAEEGHTVSFRLTNTMQRSATKETVTFTTNNKEEAFAWANDMVLNGYQVTVQYDEGTGYYKCIAVK